MQRSVEDRDSGGTITYSSSPGYAHLNFPISISEIFLKRLTLHFQTLLLIESIVTQVGQRLGFGKKTEDIPIQNLTTIALGASVVVSMSCFASTLSKISFGVTLLRLTSGPLRAFVWFCIITLFLVMIPSALLTWISCRPMAKAWNHALEGECWDGRATVGYGIFNAAWCVAADFALALLPWKLVWGLRLRLREKVGVGIAMSMGLLAGICAIVKGAYLVQLTKDNFFCEYSPRRTMCRSSRSIDNPILTVDEQTTAKM